MVKTIPILLLASCVTLGELLRFGVLEIPHLYNEKNSAVYLRVVVRIKKQTNIYRGLSTILNSKFT